MVMEILAQRISPKWVQEGLTIFADDHWAAWTVEDRSTLTAEALSSLLRNERWIKPLVLEPLNASLIQRATLRVFARRPRQGTNDSTPPAPQFQCWLTAKDSCKGNDLRS